MHELNDRGRIFHCPAKITHWKHVLLLDFKTAGIVHLKKKMPPAGVIEIEHGLDSQFKKAATAKHEIYGIKMFPFKDNYRSINVFP